MKSDAEERHLALLGVGLKYGAPLAGMFDSVLGKALALSNRNAPIVEALGKSFSRVFVNNAEAMAGARFVGLLSRPDQVQALVDEIGPYLSDDQVLVNFTAARLIVPRPLIQAAIWPPIDCRAPVAFVAFNGAVDVENREDFGDLLSRVSDHVFEVGDCQAQLGLMARTIVHTCMYMKELENQGYDEKHVCAHLRAVAAHLGEVKTTEIVAHAATAGGMSSQLQEYFNDTGVMKVIAVAEERITDEYANRNIHDPSAGSSSERTACQSGAAL
ncbi:hypothetical protein [Endozoicomonas sp. ALC066]|uniref:hypothetical protein n=1 Tax=Endozoicomonas sp. ALC066 TaxID=3403078 RepID=UPI003BB488D5